MMNVSPLGDTAVCTYSIDHPVTDNPRYEMCGLRQSYYKITKELYLKAGNARNCCIGTRTPSSAAYAVRR